jgi:hypothetical protein
MVSDRAETSDTEAKGISGGTIALLWFMQYITVEKHLGVEGMIVVHNHNQQ